MNTLMKKLAIFSVMLCLGIGVARAECSANNCTNVYVTQLYVEAAGGLWLQTSGTETALSCTPTNGTLLRLASSAVGFKDIYALLLAAHTSNQIINVRIVTSSNPCAIQYVTWDRQ